MNTAPTLTHADRCDRCGAAALVLVQIAGSDLLFCGHHYRQNADALFLAGADVVIDNRPATSASPTTP